jgi:HEAT repeat protein
MAVLAPGLAGPCGQDSPAGWIDRLADEDLRVRDEAAARLHAAGRVAWPELARAAGSHPDPEARARAADLLARARQRRRLSHRVLDAFPGAVDALVGGSAQERARLALALSGHLEEGHELILEFLRDPDDAVAVAAAEALYAHRLHDWMEPLLARFAAELSPCERRMGEMLAMAASRQPLADLQRTFDAAGPAGQRRLMGLALGSYLPLAVPPPRIREMLLSPDPDRRRTALQWMRDRGDRECVIEAAGLLHDEDPSVLPAALGTLRALRLRPDPARVATLLHHEDAAVRQEAAQAVAAFGERPLARALRGQLEDPVTAVRSTALRALWELDGAAALPDVLGVFLRDAGDPRNAAAAILGRHLEWALPRAKEHSRDVDPELRLRAYEILAAGPGTAPIIDASRDPDEAVRRWALERLARRMEDPGAMAAVEGLAADASDAIRLEAHGALARAGRREHVASIRGFLSNRHEAVRRAAAEYLIEEGSDAALAREGIGDPSPVIRSLSFECLTRLGDPAGVDAAIRSLPAPSRPLRIAAAAYLEMMLSRRDGAGLAAKLASALEGAEGDAAASLLALIIRHGDAACAAAVRRAVASGAAPRPERAVAALADWAGDRAAEELLPLLGADVSLNDAVFARARELRRRDAARIPPALEAALRKLLAHPDRDLRRSAVSAAEDLGLATDLLPGLIDDPEPSVRAAAVGACARLGRTSTARAIAARLDDEDPDVRITAATVLPRLDPGCRAAIEAALAAEVAGWARARLEGVLASLKNVPASASR